MHLAFAAFTLMVTTILAAPVDVNNADVGLLWNRVHREIIRSFGISPPLASRNMAIVHTGMYQVYTSQDVSPDQKASEASIAAFRVLSGLYNVANPNFGSSLATFNAPSYPDPSGSPGDNIAASLLSTHKQIALSTNAFSSVPLNTPPSSLTGPYWSPLNGQPANGLLPQYGNYQPFAIDSVSNKKVDPKQISLTDKDFINAYNEVKLLGGSNSSARTADQTSLAWFWHDGPPTPPGHWNLIAEIFALRSSFKSESSVTMYYLLNLALADAAISCWHTKFSQNWFRPILAISSNPAIDRNVFAKDESWLPLIPTPPFPEYVSGHSTFSSAAGRILIQIFGDISFAQQNHATIAGPLSRSFKKISDAVNEAGRSRIMGGIHYETGNQGGLQSGDQIGQVVWDKFKQDALVRNLQNVAKVAKKVDGSASQGGLVGNLVGGILGNPKASSKKAGNSDQGGPPGNQKSASRGENNLFSNIFSL